MLMQAPSCEPRKKLTKCPDEITENINPLLFHIRINQRKELLQEIDTFRRLLYKNKNQHKSAKFFGKLELLMRIIKKIEKMNVSGVLSELVSSLFSGNGGGKKLRGFEGKSPEYVPQSAFVANAAEQVLGLILLLRKLRETALEAHLYLREYLCQGLFMPVALVFMATIAKISALFPLEKNFIDLLELLEPIASAAGCESLPGLNGPISLSKASVSTQSATKSMKSGTKALNIEKKAFQIDSVVPSESPLKPEKRIAKPKEEKQPKKKQKKQDNQKPKTSTNEIDDIFGFL